jgi:hypothetical protein
MARVEVRQLRYRGDPARAGRVEFAVADALRTEVVDDGRLVLVRSFRLGRIGLAERGASQATASAWRAIRGEARHGGASGAESANCVWFADLAEARTLLMRTLASGRTPFAWFWLLAVPDWRRETLAQWLGRRLDVAVRDASGELAAALVAEAVAADCAEALAGVILARIPPPRAGELPPKAWDRPGGQGESAGESPDRVAQPVDDAPGEAVALAIVQAIPASLRTVLKLLAARAELAAFVETLARGLVKRAHPALALAPARVAAIAAAVARILRVGEPRAREAPAPPTAEPGEARASTQDPTADSPPLATDRVATPRPMTDGAVDAAPAVSAPAIEMVGPSAELLPGELRSAGAGLFLAIVPLIRLGWREWLAERPHLLLHQPGQRLLRRIAAHYRVPPSDPLWSHLPPVDPGADAPPEIDQALQLWRAGLDGWLRRKARLRLADLVLRRGWLLPGVETTLVRFPLETIEIRLRRLALDGDPGWVDWLGHSYRLVYRDRPLLGGERA